MHATTGYPQCTCQHRFPFGCFLMVLVLCGVGCVCSRRHGDETSDVRSDPLKLSTTQIILDTVLCLVLVRYGTGTHCLGCRWE